MGPSTFFQRGLGGAQKNLALGPIKFFQMGLGGAQKISPCFARKFNQTQILSRRRRILPPPMVKSCNRPWLLLKCLYIRAQSLQIPVPGYC